MPEPCLQCLVHKDSAVKNCSFHRLGVPCGPCDALHVSSCEYYLPAAHRGEVRDLIRQRVATHAPSGKFLTYFLISKFFLIHFCITFLVISSLMEQINEDVLHMHTLLALLKSICHHRDANLQEFSNALTDLCLTAKSDTLVGNVFVSQEEFASWFKFAQEFMGTKRALTLEGSSHADLEELALWFTHDKSPPIAGPSSFATHPHSPMPPHLLIPPTATDSPVAQASHNSEEDEDEVLDQLAGEYS